MNFWSLSQRASEEEVAAVAPALVGHFQSLVGELHHTFILAVLVLHQRILGGLFPVAGAVQAADGIPCNVLLHYTFLGIVGVVSLVQAYGAVVHVEGHKPFAGLHSEEVVAHVGRCGSAGSLVCDAVLQLGSHGRCVSALIHICIVVAHDGQQTQFLALLVTLCLYNDLTLVDTVLSVLQGVEGCLLLPCLPVLSVSEVLESAHAIQAVHPELLGALEFHGQVIHIQQDVVLAALQLEGALHTVPSLLHTHCCCVGRCDVALG